MPKKKRTSQEIANAEDSFYFSASALFADLDRFAGRQEEMALIEGLLSSGKQAAGVWGKAGMGKTWLGGEIARRLTFTESIGFKIEKAFFVDCRQGKGTLYGELLLQFSKLFSMSHERTLLQIVEKENIQPEEMAAMLAEALQERSFLFIFDSVETWWDERQAFHDPRIQEFISCFFREVHSNLKFLFVSRDKKNPIESDSWPIHWIHLGNFKKEEGWEYVKQFSELRGWLSAKKGEIKENASGNPFELKLFVQNSIYFPAERNRILTLRGDERQTFCHYSFRELTEPQRHLLETRSLFLEEDLALPMLEAFWSLRCQEESRGDYLFQSLVSELANRGLVKIVEEMEDKTGPIQGVAGKVLEMRKQSAQMHLPAFVQNSILNLDSPLCPFTQDRLSDLYKLLAEFYYSLFYQQVDQDKRGAYYYLADALENALLSKDLELMGEFLGLFLEGYKKFVLPSRVADLFLNVARGYLRLGASAGNLDSVITLIQELADQNEYILAQALGHEVDRHPQATVGQKLRCVGIQGDVALHRKNFTKALKCYQKIIEQASREASSHKLVGAAYHKLGLVYESRREWDSAVKNYGQAIDWFKKTGDESALGGTYHQLARVSEEQELWSQMKELDLLAVEWIQRTKNGQLAIALESISRNNFHYDKDNWKTLGKWLNQDMIHSLRHGKKDE